MDKNPMERILEQLQKEEGGFLPAPGEEMTHVAGVSFVDANGLSLGAAPQEEAGHAGAYRHIANCADALEALVLEEEERQELLEREGERSGGEGEHQAQGRHDDYSIYHHSSADSRGHHNSSSNRDVHSSTRLKGGDRHVVIERKSSNELAVVVLKKKTEDSDREDEGDEDATA
ncbi:unnamed protein product [Pylaiella littoralis]